MKLTHEYDERGHHRIVATRHNGSVEEGEWTGYQGVACIVVGPSAYIAVSDYHGGTLGMEPNVVYQLLAT